MGAATAIYAGAEIYKKNLKDQGMKEHEANKHVFKWVVVLFALLLLYNIQELTWWHRIFGGLLLAGMAWVLFPGSAPVESGPEKDSKSSVQTSEAVPKPDSAPKQTNTASTSPHGGPTQTNGGTLHITVNKINLTVTDPYKTINEKVLPKSLNSRKNR